MISGSVELAPAAQVAHQLATTRVERRRMETNAILNRLERDLVRWRYIVKVTRDHPALRRMPAFREEQLRSMQAKHLAAAVARLADLGQA